MNVSKKVHELRMKKIEDELKKVEDSIKEVKDDMKMVSKMKRRRKQFVHLHYQLYRNLNFHQLKWHTLL